MLIAEIDQLMAACTPDDFDREMARLRPDIEQANMSTVCDKRELNMDVVGPKLNYATVARMLMQDTAQALGRKLTAPFRKSEPEPAYVPGNP